MSIEKEFVPYQESLELKELDFDEECFGFYTEEYKALIKNFGKKTWRRPMVRFDFADEWNNLGYGPIRLDNSIWSLAMPLVAPDSFELASLSIENRPYFSYASLSDEDGYSVLWFNRYVGPIDSFEWRVVEVFLAHYRNMLPCYPVIKEIPWGHDAAITMRLDCDEDVASASFLLNAYKEMNVPLSFAIHTSSFKQEKDKFILNEALKNKGSVLSHSHTHAPNWGGDYESAKKEALISKMLIEEYVDVKVRYAVSPFHQSPSYALKALCDAGYDGCVGGIIRNDPEFILARGGSLSGIEDQFIGHSQQVMLHGDCILKTDDPLSIYKQSFDYAYETQMMFGYLDHPFSDRYQYGWESEELRIKVHQAFINYIKTKAKNPIFFSEDDALDFMRCKSSLLIFKDKESFCMDLSKSINQNLPPFSVEYKGKMIKAYDGALLS